MKSLDCNQIKIYINLEIIGEENKTKKIYLFLKKNYIYIYIYIYVGPNNLWARPIYLWGVQRPKPRRTMTQAQ